MEIPLTRNLFPIADESTNQGVSAFNIFSRLRNDRIIFLGTPVDDQIANLIVAQMLFLEQEAADQDIRLYINSPGGDVYSSLAIYDAMQTVTCDVATCCMGTAAGTAALLLAGGAIGKRLAVENARVVLSPVTVAVPNSGSEIEAVTAASSVAAKLFDLFSRHSGQPAARIEADARNDLVLTATEAVEYGLVDRLATRVNATGAAAS
jgi:ATP-dependent Clp protease protease subunit